MRAPVEFVVLVTALVPVCSSWAVVYVDLNAPGPSHDGLSWDTAFLTIQEGVGAATPDGEVWVADGTYVESISMGEGVQLYGGFLGAEPGGYETDLSQRNFTDQVATIDGNQASFCVTMAEGSRLDGFSVTNCASGGGGVFTRQVSCTIAYNNVRDNLGRGIYCYEYASAVITGNTITGNTAQHRDGGGICCVQYCSAVITGNTIAGNTAVHGGGIDCEFGSSPTITGNTISDNSATGVGGGVYCAQCSSATLVGNTICRNSAAGTYNGGGGICCTDSSLTVTGNTITDNLTTGEYAGGGGIYCDDSSVVLAENTISGNAAHLGGGIYCASSSAVLVENTFADNTAERGGGGLGCGQSTLYAAGNTITGNSVTGAVAYGVAYGGGIACDQSVLSIVGDTITGNTAASSRGYGGGIGLVDSSGNVSGNTIEANTADGDGGGVYCDGHPLPVLTANIITYNSAGGFGGGIACHDARLSTTNNVILGNSAGAGGGAISCRDSDLDLYNNILAENTSLDAGGGIWCDVYSVAILSHNDVWGNAPDDYWGWSPGTHDISADPLFADPSSGDYHLTADSPCIDAGSRHAPGLPYQDYEGDPRVCDGNGDAMAVVDIGADEYRLESESCTSPLGWFVPGWVWFSVPLAPRGSADASQVLGFDCRNRVYAWDEGRKTVLLYPDEFTDLVVGTGYMVRLAVDEEHQPIYEGCQPGLPFERLVPSAGWCWVGVPALQDILGVDLRLQKDGVSRTPAEDRDAADPWLNWNWIFWDPVARGARIMDPFGSGDDDRLHPWWGYRVWSNAEGVTVVFP